MRRAELLDHLMKQAVQAGIEEAKEQRGRGTGRGSAVRGVKGVSLADFTIILSPLTSSPCGPQAPARS